MSDRWEWPLAALEVKTQVKRRNVIIPIKHTPVQNCSTKINLFGTIWERFPNLLAWKLPRCGHTWSFLELLEVLWHWETVLNVCWKGVAPADSELTCSTEQCCTEYLWHWNSWVFLSSPVLWTGVSIAVRASVAPRLFTCSYTVHHVLVDYVRPPLFDIKAQTHVTNTCWCYNGTKCEM